MTFGQFLSIVRARKWAALLVFALVVVTGLRNKQPYRLEVDLPTVFAAGGKDKLVLT